MANALLSGFGGFLSGGLDKFNAATSREDEERQKAAQLALQQEQMRRAIANDERTAAYQDAQLAQNEAQQASLDDQRKFQQGESLLKLGYKGTLTPEQADVFHPSQRAVALEEVPRGPLDSIPQIGAQNPDGSIDAPPDPNGDPRFRLRESESERMSIANLNAQTRLAAGQQTNALRERELAQQRELGLANIMARIAGQNRSEPLVPVKGADGRVIYLPRNQAAGMEVGSASGKGGAGGGADLSSLPATMKQALTQADVARGLITELNDLYTYTGVRNHMGPYAGPTKNAWEKRPNAEPDTDWTAFVSATARLKNATIQAITGAAVGVQEEKRIMSEIPTENDLGKNWEIKAQQTLKNIEMLENSIYSVAGGTRPTPAQPVFATSHPTTAGRGAGSAPTAPGAPGNGLRVVGAPPVGTPPSAPPAAPGAAPGGGDVNYEMVNGKLVRVS
jgi:hypothetical protein